MIELTGLHLLLTYTCNYECDHCFVWGGPRQEGVMTADLIDEILAQAEALGTVEWIYFEGGEPFLYYPLLRYGVVSASEREYTVGIVSNSYWATSARDAALALEPLAGRVQDLSVSADAYHGEAQSAAQATHAQAVAQQLAIPMGTISIANPEGEDVADRVGQLPQAESGVMHRGRAAAMLAPKAPHAPWQQFMSCPYENLRDPGRVHIDPLGYVHVCQGITMGNLLQKPLVELVAAYDPDAHPICGPLLQGGPAALAQSQGLTPAATYADACHFCYETRQQLRGRFPQLLAPDQMYGAG